MRSLLLVLLSLAITAVGGWVVCVIASANPHAREMTLACGTIVIASAAGLVPLLLSRHATQLGISQAALVGTMTHLFVGISIATVALLGRFRLHNAFMWWLLAFYWTSLLALAAVFARAVRNAPPAATSPKS